MPIGTDIADSRLRGKIRQPLQEDLMNGNWINNNTEGGSFMKKEDKELTDIQLRDAVLDQLDKDPKVTSTEIGVGASHGVITLTGYVHRDVERREAERVARKVAGG